MALQTLNPPISWKPKQELMPEDRHLLWLPPRRLLGRAVSRRGGCRAAVGNGGFVGGEGIKVRTKKDVDLATLGNLCVDIVLNVPSLPPSQRDERKAYMDRLAASSPDKKFWEAGGNCNLAIAAARLGLSCITLGHVGEEIYGNFLLNVLQDESIRIVGMNENAEATAPKDAYETLLCWVLVDPFQKHGFCSRADFSEDPAFYWINKLSRRVKMAIQQSKILFCNGYSFDELSPDVIISALDCAIDAGTATFFDPGPRGRTLSHGSPGQQRALESFLKYSDVLLLTSEEALSLTGIANPILAGQELLRKGVRTKWVVIKMGSKGSVLIDKSIISCAPAFKVNVVDTVGCGDSFTAAIAFGYLHNMPAVNTLVLANAVGAATATGCGAGRNVAHLEKVLELLKRSHLNEDDNLWSDLLEGNSLDSQVLLLSKTSMSRSDRLVRIPTSDVVSELLHMFEAACERSVLQT
ncbi:probable fructokinase-4 [Typha angustifolia]|uniref:probable fructokinase-4 n=1 Tax=Typha angustifolia TaxID=59011 RepID=UPI003C2C9327